MRPIQDGGEGMGVTIAMEACRRQFSEPSLSINTINNNNFRDKMKLSESGKQLVSRGH